LTIEALYNSSLNGKTDISEHMPTLYKYGCLVNHITEFGIRTGNSTVAFLLAKPAKMVSYDIVITSRANEIEATARREGLDFSIITGDTARVDIAPTDLLFIDTRHTYEQVSAELRQHPRVAKYIILHDTESYGLHGDGGNPRGIWEAISVFLRSRMDWEIHAIYTNNNGLTILKRR
jgi:cephalosporin hydroxylase